MAVLSNFHGKRCVIFTDTGGTFTDAIVVFEDGTFLTGKSSTTYGRLEISFFESIKDALSSQVNLEKVLSSAEIVGYGTTHGTNIIVSGVGGAKVGVITTKGHEDRTIIGRLRAAGLDRREGMHIVRADKPEPLVPRRLIRGVIERLDCKGNVVVPLDEDSVRHAVRDLLKENVDGIAVCLLWSFLNPIHELRVKEIIQEMASDVSVVTSHEVTPVFREYPRFISTIVDLYIGAALRELFEKIKGKLSDQGYKHPLQILQASGGLSRAEVVRPGTTLHSGPVGGLIGVEFIKRLYGYENALGTDVGGTSFDICFSPKEGSPLLREPIVGRFEIATPMREIVTIGSGGGSIAWIEPATGVLKVGPQSAGSEPGPVCYDTGGTEPTVTDADVVLGRIDPNYFLGGKMKLNKKKAWKAIEEKIANPLEIDVPEAAESICKIIDGTMNATLQTSMNMKGYDPTSFICVAYGGAGPTHCAGYTEGIGFRSVIIPPQAAVFSAFGASTAGLLHRYEASCMAMFMEMDYDEVTGKFQLENLTSLSQLPSEALDRINSIWERLEERAKDDASAEGFSLEDMNRNYEMLARYGGQLWELRVPLKSGKINSIEDFKQMVRAFELKYLEVYGEHAMFPAGGLEVVSLSLEIRKQLWEPRIPKIDKGERDPSKALKSERDVYFNEKWINTRVYERSALKAGNIVEGPAIIEAKDTTIVIPLDRKVRVDDYGMLIMSDK